MLEGIRNAIGLLRRQEQLLMISISTVLVMTGQGVIAPVLPLFAVEFGVGAATVGLTLTAFALARLVLNVPLGILSDRRGRRLLLVAGPLITAAGMTGSGLAGSIGELLAWRFVAGAGSAMYMTGAQVYLVDISTSANRARFIGTNQGALLLGVSIGPAVGGLVAEAWGLRAPFYLVGATALVAALYAWLRLPETRHLSLAAETEEAEAEAAAAAAAGTTMGTTGAAAGSEAAEGEAPPELSRPARRAWVQLVTSWDFVAVALVTMAIFFTRTAARGTLMPLFADGRLGMSPGALGGLFTLMAVISLVLLGPASYVADRFGRKAAIVPSGIAVGAALLFMATTGSIGPFVAASVLLAVGSSIAGPAPAAFMADIAPAQVRGLAMGFYRSSGDVGFVIGPPLLGAIADATTLGWGLAVNAGLVTATAVFFALVARETVARPTR